MSTDDDTLIGTRTPTVAGKDGRVRPMAGPQFTPCLTVAWTPDTSCLGYQLALRGDETLAINRKSETFSPSPRSRDFLALNDKQMSRTHAEISRIDDSSRAKSRFLLRDLGSTNGTYVNGTSVDDKGLPLELGDVVSMGDTILLFQEARTVAPPDTSIPAMLGRSDAIRSLRTTIRQYARAQVPALIQGETGVGKELVAQALATLAGSHGQPYVTFNAAATPSTLVDATLFGNVRGAFTGAEKARDGLFKTAHTGTLFLDEIGELSSEVQVKLLRVLQEGEITPVGMDRPLRVKVRLITATNRNLLEEIREGRFRKDLYPRLNKLQLKVPPLRERRQDIPLLAHHLAERFMGEPVEFSTEALTRLMMHSWPLNVRGLDGVVTQAVVDWSGQHGPVELSSVAVERMNELQDLAGPAKGTELTRERVEEVLRRTRGNMKKTAQELNLDRGYLYRVLKKMDLKADDYRNK